MFRLVMYLKLMSPVSTSKVTEALRCDMRPAEQGRTEYKGALPLTGLQPATFQTQQIHQSITPANSICS